MPRAARNEPNPRSRRGPHCARSGSDHVLTETTTAAAESTDHAQIVERGAAGSGGRIARPTFADLGLSEAVLRAIDDMGYRHPTPIQEQAIPFVLMGRDVLGTAQTGTGKTAGFTLPMLDILTGSRARARMPRSLILEPTRELALQVAENFVQYGKYLKLTHALIIGGESMSDQKDVLMRGVDVLIATPGRLIDMFERGTILLTDAKHPGDRRGRPHAGHGLHPRCRADRRAAAAQPADAVLLRHHGAGDPPPRRCVPAQSEGDRGLAARLGGDDDHRGPGAGRRARQARGAAPADPDAERAERADLLQPQERRGHPAQVADAA